MMLSKIIPVLVCCATVGFAEWRTYHGGADFGGYSNRAVPVKPELLWRYAAGGAVYNTPVSDGGQIFFSTQKGRVIALDLKGAEVWKKTFVRTNDAAAEVSVRFEAPLACSGGLVFAGTSRGTLYALDAGTGTEKWRYEMGGGILGSPNFSGTNQVVVIDQSEGALHGLEMSGGTLLWKTEGVERCDGSPGIGNNRIVFGSCLAELHVYGTNGKHLKDIEVGGDGQIAGGVAIDGTLAFFGVRDGSLICADLEVGDILWSSDESKDQTFTTPAVTSDKVIYSSDDGFVYAVGRQEGKLIWKFDTLGLPSSPVVAKDKGIVSADGALYLLSLKDGRKLWSKEVSDEITSPALVDGLIVVGADDGTVTAFGKKE
jgi:outer membrane protein assembly factor BamB